MVNLQLTWWSWCCSDARCDAYPVLLSFIYEWRGLFLW